MVHTVTSDQTILTARVCPEDESIAISELDLHDIERIRSEDPFMYHSIAQHVRKMRLSGFVSHLDFLGDELRSPDPSPADTAAGDPNPSTIPRDAAFINNNNNNNRGPPHQPSNAQLSRTAEHDISPFAQRRHPFSSSFHQVPSSFSSHLQSPFPQSFPGHSSGIVTRKSRISNEVDHREDIVKLIASFSVHLGDPRSDTAYAIQSENNSDNDLNEVDLSFLGL